MILIKYCGMWGYKAEAQVVGKEINDVYPNMEINYMRANKGQFDVIYESDPPALLFSKYMKNRFPKEGEIVKLLGDKNG